MVAAPPQRVIDAFLSPVSRIHRRIEVYEQDGVTPWRSDLWGGILVGGSGSVSASYGDSERRTFECELDNRNGDLDPTPDKLWYDKVFKVYYGIDLPEAGRVGPSVYIIEENNAPGQAQNLAEALAEAGVTNVNFVPYAGGYDDVKDADIVVSIGEYTLKGDLLKRCHDEGKSVWTFASRSLAGGYDRLVMYTDNSSHDPSSVHAGAIDFKPTEHRYINADTSWGMTIEDDQDLVRILTPGAVGLASIEFNDETDGNALKSGGYGVIALPSRMGNHWVHVTLKDVGREAFRNADGSEDPYSWESFKRFLRATVDWLNNTGVDSYYECQIGEFISTSLGHASESGDTISVSCVDYTRRCQNSKLAAATMFERDEDILDIVRAVASNAHIRKFNLPGKRIPLSDEVMFESDTTRWDIIVKLCHEAGYDVFFDGEGMLTVREMRDPAESAPSLVLTSGEGGNLVSRQLSTSDAELYNHVIVIGESDNDEVPPVVGEAINNDPLSPTSVDNLGPRVRIETMSTVKERSKAQEMARTLLGVSSLEEFELSFSSVFFPWVEPGEVLEYIDETRSHWGATRYMITSLDLPLDLSPMSGTGKRVVNVQ